LRVFGFCEKGENISNNKGDPNFPNYYFALSALKEKGYEMVSIGVEDSLSTLFEEETLDFFLSRANSINLADLEIWLHS